MSTGPNDRSAVSNNMGAAPESRRSASTPSARPPNDRIFSPLSAGGASADAVYHSEQIRLHPVVDAPLTKAFVGNIHASGPNVFAYEVYVQVGRPSEHDVHGLDRRLRQRRLVLPVSRGRCRHRDGRLQIAPVLFTMKGPRPSAHRD